jgi:tripartite-type tricarboxylate transporter receptor subunit TctC
MRSLFGRVRFCLAAISVLLVLGAWPGRVALAQAATVSAWPSKPVKFVVPFPPGGSVDPLARILAARLAESLGQPFIVENRPGASGSIGAAFVVKSPADGYTFVFVFDTHAVNPALFPLPFDTAKDLAPVMLIGTAPMAIATHPAKPYRSFQDVIETAKAKPGTITYGSIGNGSLGHLSAILLSQAAGVTLVHVPYKGGGPMTQDALGGQVELAIGSVVVLAPHVKGGKLRALAVTGDKRSASMPEVPALAELGFPGFSALAWWGVFAPAGTSEPVLGKLHSELVKALNIPELRRQLTEQLGMDLVASTPDALHTFLLAEMSRWGEVVKRNQVRPD